MTTDITPEAAGTTPGGMVEICSADSLTVERGATRCEACRTVERVPPAPAVSRPSRPRRPGPLISGAVTS